MSKPAIEVEFIAKRPSDAAGVAAALDAAGVKPVTLDIANWRDTYPYKPIVSFRLAHTGNSILISWNCDEDTVRGVADDNGAVWEDSCVEFFISFDGGESYYNIECNCRGGKLCGYGKGHENRVRAAANVLNRFDVAVSMGRDAFDTRKAEGPWQMSMIIPLSVFTHGAPANLRGITADANFYKCGDALPRPHFLSWSKVETPLPNFHRPEFFGHLHFK